MNYWVSTYVKWSTSGGIVGVGRHSTPESLGRFEHIRSARERFPVRDGWMYQGSQAHREGDDYPDTSWLVTS